jgi:hypothetical protein
MMVVVVVVVVVVIIHFGTPHKYTKKLKNKKTKS